MRQHLRQLASESMIYGVAGVATRFLSIFLVPLYTRIFSPADYGIMSLVLTTMAAVTIFGGLGLDNSAHRWYWDTEDTPDRKRTLSSWAWCQVALSIALALPIVVFASDLAALITGSAEYGPLFALGAINLPLSAFATVVMNWLRMRRRPWATMAYTFGTSLGSILLTLALVLGLGWGLPGIFAAQAIASALGGIAAIWLMRDWLAPRWFNMQRLREMLRFAVPLIPAALAFWVVNLADRYFVQLYASTTDVGLYAVGSALAAGVAFVTNAFQQAWGPFALSIHKQADAKHVYAHVLLIYLWITCFISLIVTLFAPEVLQLLTTDAYTGASSVVRYLSLSYVMIGLSYIASVGPSIARTSAPTGIAITIAALLNIALNVALVPLLGKDGAALATLASQSVVPIYLFYRSQQLYPLPYRFGPAAALVALTGLLMALDSIWPPQGLWAGAATKLAICLLFVPAPLAIGVVTPDQARRLLRSVRLRQGV